MYINTKNIVIVATIGVLLGIFTSFGQTYLPDPFRQLANSYSIWLFFSFIAGYILKTYKKAAIAGIVLQYLAILFYYLTNLIRFDLSFTPQSLLALNIVWIVGGTLVGPIAALAGVLVAQKSKHLPLALGFVGGLFFSEALYQFLRLGYVGEGVVFSIVGLTFLVGVYFKSKYPLGKTLLATLVFTGLMYISFAYVLAALFS